MTAYNIDCIKPAITKSRFAVVNAYHPSVESAISGKENVVVNPLRTYEPAHTPTRTDANIGFHGEML